MTSAKTKPPKPAEASPATATPPPAAPVPDVPGERLGRLQAPFDSGEVKFKPAVVTGNRALALPYVDARVVMDRLDEVFGVAGWQTEYQVLANASVECRLSVLIGGTWITKADVGSPSEQPDEGDRTKAAYSDALKRAAVQFGVSRYLYRLPPIWVDWDAQKKKFAKEPRLPEVAHHQAAAVNGQPAATPPAAAPGPEEPPPADAAPTLTDGEATTLSARLQALGLREEDYCARFKATHSVADLPRKLYPGLLTHLEELAEIVQRAGARGQGVEWVLRKFGAGSLLDLDRQARDSFLQELRQDPKAAPKGKGGGRQAG